MGKRRKSIKISRLFDYCIEGERHSNWFKKGIIKYHRMFSTIINVLVEAGFIIDKVVEPIPNEEEMNKYPEYKDNYHRADFLIVRAHK